MKLTPANLAVLNGGFKTTFQKAFAGAPAPDWAKVAMPVKSDSSDETYGWLGKFPNIREWLGDRTLQNLSASSYNIRNRSFEGTVVVERDDVSDDKFGIYATPMEHLGLAAARFPDDLVFPLLKAGASTVCYDGQYFFDTDHPVVQADGSTVAVSNWGGGGGALWCLLCTTQPLKPMIYQERQKPEFVAMDDPNDESVFSRKQLRYGVDLRANAGFGVWHMAYASRQELTPTNYASARAALAGMKADGGAFLKLRGNLLVCASSIEGKAMDIAKAEQVGGTTNVWRNTCEVLATPYFND